MHVSIDGRRARAIRGVSAVLRLCVSLDLRRAKTMWLLFGWRETTTSVVSDEKKVRAARGFC